MDDGKIGRRALLQSVGALTALGSAANAAPARASSTRQTPAASRASGGPYNILFLFCDQERYFRSGELPAGFRLPAHERLASRGTVFDNHRINSNVCTPSRSVVYT